MKNIATKTPSPVKGILFMLLAYFFFGVANAMVKDTTAHYTISQILFLRNVLILVPMLLYIFLQRQTPPLPLFKTPNIKQHLFRGILITVSLWGIFYGFKVLPLANATSLGFSEILFMTIVAIPFLGEKVDKPQWVAIVLGFIGVLIIAQPSRDIFNLSEMATFVMIGAACIDGVVLLYARKLGRKDSTLTILFYYGLFSTIFAGLLVPVEGWHPIQGDHIFFIIGVGIFSLLGQAAATYAFQFAPGAVLAPMIYSLLLWAVLFGYMFWGEVPTNTTFIGAAIVIACGLYIIHREKKNSQLLIPPTPLD